MLDPDAPTRDAPIAGLLNHWLVGDLKHSDSAAAPLTKPPAALVTHAGPSVKREGHRLVFLLYRQNGGNLKPLAEQAKVKAAVTVEDR